VSAQTLLVELRTEELPPKALARLGRSFADALSADLARDALLGQGSATRWFATPRRLAVQISGVLETAADKPVELTGPSVKAGLDPQGNPTPALQGFARKNGIPIDALEQRDTPKGRVFFFKSIAKGTVLETTLAHKVASALAKLPIPKVMRWGAGDAEFVRPAHGLIMLHGERIVPGSVLGLASGRTTLGHRFLSCGAIEIPHADEYERVLRERGSVVASFESRKAAIAAALEAAAGDAASLAADENLLDEVTALVEDPIVYQAGFSPEFLEVPQECLILSMKQHQKYFPLLDRSTQKLLPRFLVVSNLKTDAPATIIHGNERVLRARLSDAKFFYDQDRKVRLEDRVAALAHVVYQNRLGTQLERSARVQALAGAYARALEIDPAPVERSARLAKADLLTGMVGEFPELQGIMGRYYALHDGESAIVADAIEAHYRPRFAGDLLPQTPTASAVALADKLETLAGLFGIGEQPTGDKDPYALRRQALGVIRILSEGGLPLELPTLVAHAFSVFSPKLGLAPALSEVVTFIFDRMRGYFVEAGYTSSEVEAVLSIRPERIDLIRHQLEAVRMFNTLPEAPSLAAANKRIGNILKKADRVLSDFDPALLIEPAEKTLAAEFATARNKADAHFAKQDYSAMLQTLAALKAPVDAFFEGVMVMAEDTRLRDNRIALLAQLQQTMNRIADISRLAA
jgi:glycyl-tRNA synthetase beta chain